MVRERTSMPTLLRSALVVRVAAALARRVAALAVTSGGVGRPHAASSSVCVRARAAAGAWRSTLRVSTVSASSTMPSAELAARSPLVGVVAARAARPRPLPMMMMTPRVGVEHVWWRRAAVALSQRASRTAALRRRTMRWAPPTRTSAVRAGVVRVGTGSFSTATCPKSSHSASCYRYAPCPVFRPRGCLAGTSGLMPGPNQAALPLPPPAQPVHREQPTTITLRRL